MLFNSYDFLFCSLALTPSRSSCLKNTWQHNCIRESLQMIKGNFHRNLHKGEKKKKKEISILCYRELKIPFTELETETHVRDLFTRRYTLMFAQDKQSREKVFKIKLGGKQIGSKAIFTGVLSRKRRKFLWFQKENLIKFKFFPFVILTLMVLSLKLVLNSLNQSLEIESADNSSINISNSRQTFVFIFKYVFNCSCVLNILQNVCL